MSDTRGPLDGKVALVTGGNSGIGLASAKELVARGAHVFITGRRRDALDAAVTSIGRNVTAIRGDAGDLNELDLLFTKIGAEKGHLEIVFPRRAAVRYVPLWCRVEVRGDLRELHAHRPSARPLGLGAWRAGSRSRRRAVEKAPRPGGDHERGPSTWSIPLAGDGIAGSAMARRTSR